MTMRGTIGFKSWLYRAPWASSLNLTEPVFSCEVPPIVPVLQHHWGDSMRCAWKVLGRVLGTQRVLSESNTTGLPGGTDPGAVGAQLGVEQGGPRGQVCPFECLGRYRVLGVEGGRHHQVWLAQVEPVGRHRARPHGAPTHPLSD